MKELVVRGAWAAAFVVVAFSCSSPSRDFSTKGAAGAAGVGVGGANAGATSVDQGGSGGRISVGGDGTTSGGTTEAGDAGSSDAGAGGEAGVSSGSPACMPGQSRACGGALGACAAGNQLCATDATWGPCSVLPAAKDGCAPNDDANCNGVANEGCPCVAGVTRSCAAAGALGSCAAGTQACSAQGTWGGCTIVAAAQDTCAPGNDDNCNGTPNQGCTCVQGTTRTCAVGGLGGKCATGTESCGASGTWGACSIAPSAKDTCVGGNDDNCNGKPNEGCACTQGATRTCAAGGLGGKCATGTETCSTQGAWGACSIVPSAKDTCVAGNDDNCNGVANEGCPCVAGGTRSCAAAGALGSCAAGTQACSTQGAWGGCSIVPASQDTCVLGNDDNCNGTPNQGCTCIQGATRTCAAGGLGGKCASGTETCGSQGTWGGCSIPPSAADTCVSGNDDNCNGTPNEGCQCINGTSKQCGACGDGMQVCSDGKTNQYGPCSATTLPVTYYRDADGDGYGSTTTTASCTGAPAGYTSQPGDCCDDGGNLALAKSMHPGQTQFFTTAANLCGIAWNYDCSAGNSIETSPASHVSNCSAPPDCTNNLISPYGEADCGITQDCASACAFNGGEHCVFHCGGTSAPVACH